METTILCPVDQVIHHFEGDLQPVLDFLLSNQPLPSTDKVFPVGTITADGRLDMCKQKLGVAGITRVTAALQKNQVIKHVLLGTNAFGNPGAMEIGALLKINTTIETVYLGCNYIESEGCKAICEALEQNNTVKSLWFKRNPIGAESIPSLIRLLQRNKNIRTLDLVNTGRGEGIPELLQYLGSNISIERLYISGNYLTAQTMKFVSDMLMENKHLRSLYVSVNDFGNEGVENLLPGLIVNTTLKELSLASSGITDEGVQQLCAALKIHNSLNMLDLGYAASTRAVGAKANKIAAEGAAAIMELSALQSLNLTRTGFPKDMIQHIIQKDIPHVVVDGMPAKGVGYMHPDSRAIKSVYR